MKMDRLIGIITILMQKEQTTIPRLAERFEVSRRTIQRDIDCICRAGIPVVTLQGYGGGLRIAEGYRLDSTVLTEAELQAVLTGVKSMDSISKATHLQTLAEKLAKGRQNVPHPYDTMTINLASWYQESLTEKIDLLRQAIAAQETVAFTYYSNRGETQREIEPYRIVYEWSDWYLYGYCLSQNDFRLFKLNRLWSLANTHTLYKLGEITKDAHAFVQQIGAKTLHLHAVFQPNVKYRLIEEYGPQCYTELADGTLSFRRVFANRGYLVQWLLSFGDQVMVHEPADVAAEIRRHAMNMQKQYE